MFDLKMKTNENSILKYTKNKVDFFLCQKDNWDISEIKLSKAEIEYYFSIKSESKRNEFLGVRWLKNKYNPEFEITYLENGRPILKNSSKFISISHSKNFIAFAAAPYPIGIDIEECQERVIRVKDRFLNESEKKIINQNSITELTQAWCVKEALFKLNKDDGIEFKTNLIIQTWDDYTNIAAKMLENSSWKLVNLHVQKIENVIICFNFE